MNNKEEFEMENFDTRSISIISELLRINASNESIDRIIDILCELKLLQSNQEKKINLLIEKTSVDETTGLLKYNEEYLKDIVKTASRILSNRKNPQYTISYIRIEIDNFSLLKDKHGEVMVEVLKKAAFTIRQVSRSTDYCIYPGNGYVDILVPATSNEGVETFVKHIYKALETEQFPFSPGITFSAGISDFSIDVEKLRAIWELDISTRYKQLQKEADEALLEARRRGKNQFCFYRDFKGK